MLEQSSTCFPITGTSGEVSLPARSASDHVNIAFALVVLFLIALYSQISLLVPGLDSLGPMNVIGGLAIAAVVVQRFINHRGIDLIWPDGYLLVVFVAAALVSCIGALWPKYALESTLDLLKYVSIYILILQTVDTEKKLRLVFWTVAVGALVPALGTLKNYLEGNLTEGRAAWIGIFANPNEVAYSLAIVIPLAAYLAVTTISIRGRAFLWVSIAAYAAAICVTFSRGGMLGLLAVVALLGLRWRSAPVLIVTVLACIVALGFMMYGWTRSESFAGLDSDLNLLQRLATFQGALAMFLENPLNGVGLGCSLIAWPLYAPSGLYTRSWLVIHNTFLQVLCETGLIGFSSFIACLGIAFFRARTISLGSDGALNARRLGTALAISLWGFVICGMSGGYILTWFPYILLALISSAFVVFKKSREEDALDRPV